MEKRLTDRISRDIARDIIRNAEKIARDAKDILYAKNDIGEELESLRSIRTDVEDLSSVCGEVCSRVLAEEEPQAGDDPSGRSLDC